MLPRELLEQILGWKRRTAWEKRKKEIQEMLTDRLFVPIRDPWYLVTESYVNHAWSIYIYVAATGTVFCSKYYGRKKKITFEEPFQVTTPDPHLTDLLEEAIEEDFCFLELHTLVEEWYDREFVLEEFHYVIRTDRPQIQFIDLIVEDGRVMIHIYFSGRQPEPWGS